LSSLTTNGAAPAAAEMQQTDLERLLNKAISKAKAETAHVPLVNGVLVPDDMDGVWRLVNVAATSGLGPQVGKGPDKRPLTPTEMFIVISAGLAAGLSWMQALQYIYLVNNRPTIFGDAVPALLWASGKLLDLDEPITRNDKGQPIAATCRMTRVGTRRPDGTYGPDITKEWTFTGQMASEIGLTKSDTWKNYPERMLLWRARTWVARDLFADVLMGLSVPGESEDIETHQAERGGSSRAAKADRVAAQIDRLPSLGATTPQEVGTRPSGPESGPSSGEAPSGPSEPRKTSDAEAEEFAAGMPNR
jgi:hypothetical protein